MKTKDSTIRDALDMFSQSEADSRFNRTSWHEDVKFARLSSQWPESVAKQRRDEGRVALTINKMAPLIRAVVNEARQSRPAIKVSPVDSGADEDTAEVIGGLIRGIERQSRASVAYDTAIDHAVTGGFGFFRIDIDYAHDETFDLEARIKRIVNPLSVHWDTSSTEFDASDWDYAFISDMLSKDEFESRYPKAKPVSFQGEDGGDHWLKDDSVRVAEWFRRVKKQTKLFLVSFPNAKTGMSDMRAVREESLPNMARQFFGAGMIDVSGIPDDDLVKMFLAATGVEVVRERMADGYDVIRRVISGVEVLEEDEWPGQSIPICPVWGDEIYLDGKRHFKSMIRDAKDSQMMFNFWRSATTELIALAPRTPYIGKKGFVPKGHEDRWGSANTRSHAYLEYEGDSVPKRQEFAGVPTGALQEATLAAMDMNDITGIYPSAIGARSNETSGKAILTRERQGDSSNFHFTDNLNRGIAYAGRLLVEIIPSLYSTRHSIRILGEDFREKVIKLTLEDGGSQGEEKLYNLAVGKFDVDVKSGPSFATQREETRETLIEIMRQVPGAAGLIGDVLMDHMDFVGADRISKRLQSLLPPEVRQAEQAAEAQQNPGQAPLAQQNNDMQQRL